MPVTAQLLFIACTVLNKHVWIPLSFPLTITITEAEKKKTQKTLKLLQGLLKRSASITPTVPHQHAANIYSPRGTNAKRFSALKSIRSDSGFSVRDQI